jgi:hypothetical protein
LIVRLVLAALLLATVACSSSNSGGGGDNAALDERTCEIGRDIAGSYNVTDTLEQSRERVADLYNGYGKAASPAIQSALRQWVSGMTSGDYKSAAKGVSAFGAACGAQGY